MRKASYTLRNLCFVALALFLLGSCLEELRSAAELESALPTQVNFPTRWETELGIISVDWKINRTKYYSKGEAWFYASSAVERLWTDRGEANADPLILVSIFQYENVPMAFFRYRLSSPEYAYWDDWPNFYFSSLARERYPSDWRYRSSFADEEHVVCGMGKLEKCQVWYYWARYGRYLVEVFFFAPNRGIGPDLFEQIVAQIDPYIGRQLQRLE